MTPSPSHTGRKLLDGTVRIFLAEALLLPTGLITAAFLTRRLGPEGYGLFTLASTLVVWVQVCITFMLSRASIKLIGDADDWRPVATTVAHAYVGTGLFAAATLCLLAGRLAQAFHEPALARILMLFAIDIPLYSLTYAHRNVLVGTARFQQQSVVSASRWVGRLVLIVLFVELGLSVPGAVMGSIGASIIEFTVARFFARPALFRRSSFPLKPVLDFALPLFMFGLSLRLFDKLDLFMLKLLGGTATEVGYYGAAQNLSIIPNLFTLAFSPLLLATIARTLRDGDMDQARSLARDGMRVALWMLPFAGMTAGCSTEVIRAIFGGAFLPAGPVLAVLIFGAVAMVLMSVSTAILTAAGKPRLTFALAGPLPIIALASHLFMIPRFGMTGASLVTAITACVAAIVSSLVVASFWQLVLPLRTLGRSIVVSLMAYVLAGMWATDTALLTLKLAGVTVAIVSAFVLLGEFSANEIATVRAMMRRRIASEPAPGEAS